MNLKPELLATMASLGVTEPELEILKSRMMFSVTSLEAQITALDAQISTLTVQRDAARQELEAALVTASKLVGPAVPEPEVGEAEPVADA